MKTLEQKQALTDFIDIASDEAITKLYLTYAEARGFIDETPTLEEVKERYKDAKVVSCLMDDEHINIEGKEIGIDSEDWGYFTVWAGLNDTKNQALLYQKGEWAEIIEYKEKCDDSELLQASKEWIEGLSNNDVMELYLKNVEHITKEEAEQRLKGYGENVRVK